MPLDDPAWLDAQYNNRARVPQTAQILARWAESSKLARERLQGKLDIRYGDQPGEALDVFPAAHAGAPVLVFIHGGYWRTLDKADQSFIAPAFVEAGATVVVPNYALCPSVTIETIALQMTRALAWVWRNPGVHSGDPNRIAIAGHSAGGHLAAMLLSCRWKEVGDDLPLRLLQGALSISGLYDLEPIRLTPFLQADLQLTPQSVKRLSPAFFPRPRGTLYAVAGLDESDEFLRQNQLIRDQWGPTSVPVCETVVGRDHFTVLHDLADPACRLHELALRLLGLR
ncbi:MAG: alpha/beta hydrolase [Ideonella sp.]|nr:MAG: alpha/beta hydrolase [Burkholderiaceae bacterium]MBE7425425.1 alpha/beta hydrolase [Ideonella sp.]